MSARSRLAVQVIAGAALGFSLGFIGFGDYGELHRMFTFADLRLFLTFAGAVVITGLGLRFLVRAPMPSRQVHKSVVVGGAFFGLGWVLTGACPGIALVQLGEGTLGAAITLAGMLLGIRACDAVNTRWLHWGDASGSCE
jgi:uncharacterized membrane protein YedE/YeeE